VITYKEKQEKLFRNARVVSDMRSNLMDYDNDPEKDRRIEKLYCKFCYYIRRGSIAGQGFTRYGCYNCPKIVENPTTDCDNVCHDCALEQKCCAKCISSEVDW